MEEIVPVWQQVVNRNSTEPNDSEYHTIMNRPSKKEIKAAVEKLKEQKSGQGPVKDNSPNQLSGKKGNQGKIRKQGV